MVKLQTIKLQGQFPIITFKKSCRQLAENKIFISVGTRGAIYSCPGKAVRNLNLFNSFKYADGRGISETEFRFYFLKISIQVIF